MKKAISIKTKKKVKKKKRSNKRSKGNSKEKRERKNKRKDKRKMRERDSNENKRKNFCPVVTEAIITKGGGYSLKYVKMCCEFVSVVSELIAVIQKSNLIFLIWGLFGSRGTPQLSLRGNGIYQKKQRSKST